MARKKATSSQVAERAGVSQATVSMILNRRNNVSFSEETKEKVERAARELGYELPHRKHKNNGRKEKLIVVFCPTLTSPYYVLLLQGIESVANEKGYGVFICNKQRDARLEERYLRMIGNIEPQGIIYTCNPNPDFQQQVEELAQTIPLVIISNKEKTTTIDAINQDNTVVGRMMARHLLYLRKKYWKTKYSVNFPRMRPSENGGFQPNVVMNDRELAQLTFAMRIFDHDVDISYSTRESAEIRNHMATLGVTTMSAESKTEPGGYYSYPQTLEQFHVSDERKAVEVERDLKKLGREPVWKDWDQSFDFKR